MVTCSFGNDRRTLPVRELAIEYYARIFMHPKFCCDEDTDVKRLVLDNLYTACSIPEVNLQRVARSSVQSIFAYALKRRKGISGLVHHDFALVSEYWGSASIIMSHPAVNSNFVYCSVEPVLTNALVVNGFREVDSLLFVIDMHSKSNIHCDFGDIFDETTSGKYVLTLDRQHHAAMYSIHIEYGVEPKLL